MDAICNLVFLAFVFVLGGCTAIPQAKPSCEEIINLRSQVSRPASAEQLTAWIVETYRLPAESVTVNDLPRQLAQLLEWRSGGLTYNASIERGVTTHIGVGAKGLRTADVITCLGQPSHYSAMYGYETAGGTQVDFNLLFPQHGVLAGGARILGSMPTQPPAITAEFPINSLSFQAPAPAAVLLEQAYAVYVSPLREQMINSYKPWSGDWQDLIIVPFKSPG